MFSSLMLADEERENYVTFDVQGVVIKTRASHILQTPDNFWIKDEWNSRQDMRDYRKWGYNLKNKVDWHLVYNRSGLLFVDCNYSYFARLLDFFRYGILDIKNLNSRLMEKVAIRALGLGNFLVKKITVFHR